MTSHVTRWVRRVLPLAIVCLFAPAAGAQTILWGTAAASGTFPNGRLLKIDYNSGLVLATYNGPAGFMLGDGFTGVAVRPDNGQVFVTDGLGTNRVLRFDPNTGTSLGSFVAPTGNQSIDGLEFFNGELYANQWASSVIVRINPDTGSLIGTLPTSFPGNIQGGLTITNGVLYSRGNTGNTMIALRNLATGAGISEFATPNNEAVRALATDGISLYAASDAGRIYRLDPNTGSVLDSRNIGVALDGLGGFTPVPEPSGGLLLLAPALLYYRWRRSRSAPSATVAAG